MLTFAACAAVTESAKKEAPTIMESFEFVGMTKPALFVLGTVDPSMAQPLAK